MWRRIFPNRWTLWHSRLLYFSFTFLKLRRNYVRTQPPSGNPPAPHSKRKDYAAPQAPGRSQSGCRSFPANRQAAQTGNRIPRPTASKVAPPLSAAVVAASCRHGPSLIPELNPRQVVGLAATVRRRPRHTPAKSAALTSPTRTASTADSRPLSSAPAKLDPLAHGAAPA